MISCGPKLVSTSCCRLKESFYLPLLAAKVQVIVQLFDNVSMAGSAKLVQNSRQGFKVFYTPIFRAEVDLTQRMR